MFARGTAPGFVCLSALDRSRGSAPPWSPVRASPTRIHGEIRDDCSSRSTCERSAGGRQFRRNHLAEKPGTQKHAFLHALRANG